MDYYHSSNLTKRGVLAAQLLSTGGPHLADSANSEGSAPAELTAITVSRGLSMTLFGVIEAVDVPRSTTSQTAATKYRIIELVTRQEGIDSEAIARELNISDKVASDLVAELCEEGILAPA